MTAHGAISTGVSYVILLHFNHIIRCSPHLADGALGPGYYYVLFEDPDGIRLEVNFVPGVGLLADGAQFNPVAGYV